MDIDNGATVFTLFYIVCSFCFVFRTNEFVSLGLTVETIFEHYLGREFDSFVFYQIKRSSLTLFIHSTLLLVYRLCLWWVTGSSLWQGGVSLSLSNLVTVVSILLPITSLIIIYKWWKDDWECHPISRNLALFCANDAGWRTLASDIGMEFRRVDKMTIRSSSLVLVVVTDNWIAKVWPYGMRVAHQSDSALWLAAAHTHQLTPNPTQYLDIRLSYSRAGRSHHFYIRLNALDFKDLENKLRRPVEVAQNIVFHRSRADQFVDVFREQVMQNPPYRPIGEVELCIGCMVNPSDVKLVKNCADAAVETRCTDCYCRPMWCVSCLARWFASRQEEAEVRPDQWLGSKCTCPVCRSVFCVLDVSPLPQA